jgi:Tol biopolymer transport system component
VETLEERLRRALQHLSPPGDPSGVVDRVLRRGARRHARRSAGIVLLTVSVIVGSIGGFYALSRVFLPPQRNVASGSTNGLIVFSDIRIAGFDEDGANVVDDWRLYTLDPIDGRVTRIGPDSVDEALFPTWSPDGMRIAFVGFRDRRASVYVAAADGSNVEEIFRPAEGQQIEGLRWSPDGSRIGYQLAQPGSGAFAIPVGDRSWTIWTMAADGTDHRQVTTTGREMHFSWSPDGTRIVFERFRPISDQSQLADAATDLYTIDADGGHELRLTNDGTSRDPAWSPDGTQIAFSHGPRGDQRLALIGVDGNGLREMTPRAEAGIFFPYGNTVAWSPDGEQIAFTGRTYDVCFISTLDVAEGNVRTLVSSPGSRSCPGQEGMSWAPAVATELPTSAETTKPTPSEAPSATATASPDLPWRDVSGTLRGVGAVCGVTSVEGDFTGDGTIDTAYVFEPEPEGGCAGPNENSQYVGVAGADGVVVAISDELTTCLDLFGCSAFAAPDVDGDGSAEIAISIGMADGAAGTLLDVSSARDRVEVKVMEVALPGNEHGFAPGPFLFLVAGGGLSNTGGSYCFEAEPGVRLFVIWWAHLRDPDSRAWDVRAATFQIQGNKLRLDWTSTYRVPDDEPELPTRIGSELCGAPTVYA